MQHNTLPPSHTDGRAMGVPEAGGYAVRTAAPEEISRLGAIERACARIFPEEVIPEGMVDDCLPDAVLAAAQREGRLYVAVESGGTPAGFALLGIAGDTASLAEIDVLPEHGRRGVGRALIEAVAEQARARGFGELYLTTFAHIPWNAPFYARIGFVVVSGSEVPEPVREALRRERSLGFLDRVAMRRVLAAPIRENV